MKLKRLISGFLASCLALSVLSISVFAAGGGQNDSDSNQGNTNNFDNWTGGSWRRDDIDTTWGYKVQLVMSKHGEVDISVGVGTGDNMVRINSVKGEY